MVSLRPPIIPFVKLTKWHAAVTKNGIQKLCGPPHIDPAQYKTENKITDEEILKILEQPLSRNTGSKSKNKKKKKSAKKGEKAANGAEMEEEEAEESDDQD